MFLSSAYCLYPAGVSRYPNLQMILQRVIGYVVAAPGGTELFPAEVPFEESMSWRVLPS